MNKTLLSSAIIAAFASAATAAVTVSTTAPTSNILSSAVGGIDTALIDEDANANHARGQLFSLSDGAGTGYEITAITLQKSVTQAYVNDVITLRIFEGTQAEWDTGTGHSTATDGSNYYVDTGIPAARQLHTEVFTLNGSITNEHFVTFQLTTPITINEDSDFGFFMTYDQVGGTQDRFRHREGSAGGRISITTTDHGVSTRQMEYYLQGTVVPEPASAALLGLGVLGLIARRRRA